MTPVITFTVTTPTVARRARRARAARRVTAALATIGAALLIPSPIFDVHSDANTNAGDTIRVTAVQS